MHISDLSGLLLLSSKVKIPNDTVNIELSRQSTVVLSSAITEIKFMASRSWHNCPQSINMLEEIQYMAI